jgi:hypothetical protein
MDGKVHVNKARVRRGRGDGRYVRRFSTSIDVDLDPSSLLRLWDRQGQHTICQLGRHLTGVDLRG